MRHKVLTYKHESDINVNFINDFFFVFVDVIDEINYELIMKYNILYLPLNTMIPETMERLISCNDLPLDENNNMYIILNKLSIDKFMEFYNNLSQYQEYTKLNLFIMYIGEDYENIKNIIK